MRFWLIFMFMFLPAVSWGQIKVKETGNGTTFPLVSSHKAVIYYDTRDYAVVEKAAVKSEILVIEVIRIKTFFGIACIIVILVFVGVFVAVRNITVIIRSVVDL